MPEELLVSHCAPTLAGLKTANLISCSCPCPAQLAQEVTRLNKQLNSKGVCVQVLSNRGKRALIYVYRPKRLEKDLNHPDTLCFLKQCGYQNGCALDLVQQLQEKLCESQDFPHEIGLFLGYPFEDVQGFIQNRGCNCRLCGYWKVYANECEKKRLFEKYSHCRNVYCRKWTEGLSIQRLTVAG